MCMKSILLEKIKEGKEWKSSQRQILEAERKPGT